MTKYFVNDKGAYLGGFDGAEPPAGSIEVPNPPEFAMMTWNGKAWIISPEVKQEMVSAQRLQAYENEGCSIQNLVVALWKRVVEGDPIPSDEIEVIRKKIQKEFPR